MTTYDGNELRERLRERLVERWNVAVVLAQTELRRHLRDAIMLNGTDPETFQTMTELPRADEPWVAALIEERALAMEARAIRLTLDAAVASVLT